MAPAGQSSEGSTKPQGRTVLWHLVTLAIFSAALFLPNLGRGFIHDDFVWLRDAAYQPFGYEFSHPVGGPFFSPLGLLTFRAGWALWGFQAFPYGAENLALHIANSFLLYLLVFLLWRSVNAAWWAAFGFALLFPANIWAVMWIATRSHLLATMFYLAALCSTIWFLRSERSRLLAGALTAMAAAASMLSKESGVTLALAIPILIWYERPRGARPVSWPAISLLIMGLGGVAVAYLIIRSQSGSMPVVSSNHPWYQYAFSVFVFVENLLRYSWRTYGLQILLAGGLALAVRLHGSRPRLEGVSRREVVLSVLLFLAALAPVSLLRGRSGIYSYLPAIGASLLFGAVARSLQASHQPGSWRWRPATPFLALALIGCGFTVGQSMKWRHAAETNGAVLRQISAQVPNPPARAFFALRYADADPIWRFPDGFATWGFSPALQLHYSDPTLTGMIAPAGLPLPNGAAPDAEFFYQSSSAGPQVLEVASGAPRE
jgi:hypothetical protein